jgi:hypothetical protein
MELTAERNWTPVRSGSIFCSPACGRRCTYAAFLEAKRASEKLAANIGHKWKPYVHENSGWHFCAKAPKGSGELLVTQNATGFTCFTGTTITGHGSTPQRAIRDAAHQLTRDAHVLVDIAAILEEAC